MNTSDYQKMRTHQTGLTDGAGSQSHQIESPIYSYEPLHQDLYNQGYIEGRRARQKAFAAIAKKYNVKPLELK